jgi:hypothetical protein
MSEPDTFSKTSSLTGPAASLVRLWPLGVLLIAALALCTGWWIVRTRIAEDIRNEAAALRAQGYQVEMPEPQFGGFPYRMRVSLASLHLSAPSGWAVRLGPSEAEAVLFDLGHWVLAVENGLTVTRPVGGDVRIGAARLRASLTALAAPTPRLAIEGIDLVLTTPPGARPFSLARAERIEIYTRTGLSDPTSAEALIRVDNGALTPGTAAAVLFHDRRVSAALSLRMIRRDAWRGTDWATAGHAWQSAGGRLDIDPTTPPGPDLRLAAGAGSLRFSSDGRPMGTLPLSLSAPDGGRMVELPLILDETGTRLGPVRLGPSLRLF